jgi:hypothetical protein
VKKVLLAILTALFTANAVVASPAVSLTYDQRKDDRQKKKDPPGPPVVKDKGNENKPKEPPRKKDRKPD